MFIFTFGYIWMSAFIDNYDDAYPTEKKAVDDINRANWWRAIISCVIFVVAYNYLEPYNLDFFAPMQRFWRVCEAITIAYLCFVIVLLNHRPVYGRKQII